MLSYWDYILLFALGLGLLSAQLPVFGASNDQAGHTAEVNLRNADKETVGSAVLRETPHGVLIHLNIQKLPEGTHAFHVHETGQCNPPDFKSAGGHFNPTNKDHGWLSKDGFHLGDLPNIYVPQSGAVEIEVLARQALLQTGQKNMLDGDGATLVIHEGKDDYRTDPAGDAGSRLACGEIERQ